MSVKDYFGTEILVGDIVTFAPSGEMEDGEVVRVSENHQLVIVKDSNGFIKHKYPYNVINKSKTVAILKDTHPEDYI
jgi:hypothetical protein